MIFRVLIFQKLGRLTRLNAQQNRQAFDIKECLVMVALFLLKLKEFKQCTR